MTLFFIFFSLAALIVICAMGLAKFAHGLADQTGLGTSITGLILLAGATSLPEFSVGVSAVRMGAADLTAGDVLGSSLINLLIIAMLDLVTRATGRILSRTAAAHALAGIVACIMTALVLLGLLCPSQWTFLRMGPFSWALIVTYCVCIRLLYLDQQIAKHADTIDSKTDTTHYSLKTNVLGFLFCAAIIFWIAPKLAHTADQLAAATGLGRTFFGTVFVATMTSLPEAVSTLASIRLKAHDMAIGNILGSNAFNMLILAFADIASAQPVLTLVSPVHAITAACVIITTGATLLCVLYRPETRWWIVEPDAVLVLLLVLGSLFLVYLNRGVS